MIVFKFLFDPQTGSYQGIAREPYPENSTFVQPHFSAGFKTCWDFKGRWKLVKEEEFFKQVNVQDVLRDYEIDLDSKHKELILVIENRFDALMRRQNENYFIMSREQRNVSLAFNGQLNEIEKHLDGLQMDLIIVQERLENIFDILTLGPLKRQVRRLMTWLGL